MKDHSFVFNYFHKRLNELKGEFDLRTYGFNPCSFRKKEDLKTFVKRLAYEVFENDDLEFFDKGDFENRVDFKYLGQDLYLEIDQRYGHIEVDFHETVVFMATLSDVMIATVNPTGVTVGGDYNSMREAWSEGLPIHIPEVKFLHKHVTGKFYKKEEIGSNFVIEEVKVINNYEENIIRSLNNHLRLSGSTIQYNSKQIMCYQGIRRDFSIGISGDYSPGYMIDNSNNKIFIRNSVLNQVLLMDYIKRNGEINIWYQKKDSSPEIIDHSFHDFISGLGK